MKPVKRSVVAKVTGAVCAWTATDLRWPSAQMLVTIPAKCSAKNGWDSIKPPHRAAMQFKGQAV
jgi:hypothetical protein